MPRTAARTLATLVWQPARDADIQRSLDLLLDFVRRFGKKLK